MAFDRSNLFSATGTSGDAPNIFTYKTDDNLATVTAAGYFNAARGALKLNDYIFVRNSAEDYMIHVTNAQADNVTAELMLYLDRLGQTSGWIQITDSTYTVGSPKALTGGVRTKLDLNSDSVIESNAPPGTTAATFWDSATSKLMGETVGDAFELRFQFTAAPASPNTNMTIDLDIGGAQGIIWEDTRSFLKGAVAQRAVRDISYYTLTTFIANGGEIYLTATNNTDIYGMTFFIRRTHKGVT